MGAIMMAIGDVMLTFMWFICSSSLGPLISVISTALGVNDVPFVPLFITTILISLLIFLFTLLGAILGGASFNPVGTVSFHAVGVDSDSSLSSMALRFPAQTIGAVLGALTTKELMLPQFEHGGPSLKVDIHLGAIVEGLLTFLNTFCVLLTVLKGPRSPLFKTWILAMFTVTLVIAGSGFTGPSMNPAYAYGWAYVNNRHNTWEHFYVYWICPFVGAIFAAWLFRTMFPPPPTKAKNA